MSSPIGEWLAAGGPVMGVLSGVGVVLAVAVAERIAVLFGRPTWTRYREAELHAVLAGGLPMQGPKHGPAEAHAISRTELELALAEYPELTRGLLLIRACVAIAPLLGLLGTVTGMIATFSAILRGLPATQIGAGISVALFTTQYGLAIAVPGLIAERLLTRRSETIARHRACIAAIMRWRHAATSTSTAPSAPGEKA